jgi:hypothetical protein
MAALEVDESQPCAVSSSGTPSIAADQRPLDWLQLHHHQQDELDAIALETSHTSEIASFVPEKQDQRSLSQFAFLRCGLRRARRILLRHPSSAEREAHGQHCRVGSGSREQSFSSPLRFAAPHRGKRRASANISGIRLEYSR